MLADMTRATDARLRELARRLAGRLVLDVARRGPARPRGDGPHRSRRRTTPTPATSTSTPAPRPSSRPGPRGAAVDPERLRVRRWVQPRTAVCLLVDRSGSMGGRPLATSAVAAAAVAFRAPDDFSVVSFAKDSRRRQVAGRARTGRGASSTACWRCAATARPTSPARSPSPAGSWPARAPGRKITILLSDCRATEPGDVAGRRRAPSTSWRSSPPPATPTPPTRWPHAVGAALTTVDRPDRRRRRPRRASVQQAGRAIYPSATAGDHGAGTSDRRKHSGGAGVGSRTVRGVTATQTDKAARFLELHVPGQPSLMPNPWDLGFGRGCVTARRARGAGHDEQRLGGARSAARTARCSRDEVVAAAAAIVAATDPAGARPTSSTASATTPPLSPDRPPRRRRRSGRVLHRRTTTAIGDRASSCPLAEAAERVAARRRRCASRAGRRRPHRSRLEPHPWPPRSRRHHRPSCRPTSPPAPDAVFAPGLPDLEAIARVVREVARPLSVLYRPDGPSVAELVERRRRPSLRGRRASTSR